MIELFNSFISDASRVLILGFGKEGRSTYSFLRKQLEKDRIGGWNESRRYCQLVVPGDGARYSS